jgi:hypothetical protein
VRLLVPPETVLRWHRDLIASPHARISGPKRVGRPRTVRSIRLLVLRRSRENSTWGYRRIHGELLVLGIRVAASTVWEILNEAGIDPAPERSSQTWAALLRSQAEAILAADFFETVTSAGKRMYILAVIEHATRPVRVLGATAHPRAARGTQAVRNLAMYLQATGCRARFLIRDRDGKYPAPADTILADTGIHVVLSGVPNRSPTRTRSRTSPSANGTVSAASSMNTNMPHDPRGRRCRHLQGRRAAGRALVVIGVIGLPIGLAGLAGVLEYLDWTLVAVIQTVLAVAAILAAILLWMSWYRSMKAASRR